MQDRRVTRAITCSYSAPALPRYAHYIVQCTASQVKHLDVHCAVHLKEQAVRRQAGRMTWECIEVVADQPEHNLTT